MTVHATDPRAGFFAAIHHDSPVEYSWDVDERIAVILTNKPEAERAARLLALTWIPDDLLPREWVDAAHAWVDASRTWAADCRAWPAAYDAVVAFRVATSAYHTDLVAVVARVVPVPWRDGRYRYEDVAPSPAAPERDREPPGAEAGAEPPQ